MQQLRLLLGLQSSPTRITDGERVASVNIRVVRMSCSAAALYSASAARARASADRAAGIIAKRTRNSAPSAVTAAVSLLII